MEPFFDKLLSFNFEVVSVDGHDHKQLYDALSIDRNNLPTKPRAIIANTIKGYGVPFFENKEGWHGRTPNEEEYKVIIQQIGLNIEELEKL